MEREKWKKGNERRVEETGKAEKWNRNEKGEKNKTEKEPKRGGQRGGGTGLTAEYDLVPANSPTDT